MSARARARVQVCERVGLTIMKTKLAHPLVGLEKPIDLKPCPWTAGIVKDNPPRVEWQKHCSINCRLPNNSFACAIPLASGVAVAASDSRGSRCSDAVDGGSA